MNGASHGMKAGDTMSGGMLKDERRKKRKELRAELEKVKREIERVEHKISKCKRGSGTGVRGGKGASNSVVSPDQGGKRGVKRKSSDHGGSHKPAPDSKEGRKQAMLKERQRRVQSLWGQCATILKQLKQNRNAWPFHKAVDWRTLNIPDYPKIVKNPMDMQTIADKLGGFDAKCKESPREYKSPLEFRDDLRLIFDNCRLYNPVGHDVRIMGDALADLFEKKWQNSNIEGKFALELEYQKKEDDDLKNNPSGFYKSPKQPKTHSAVSGHTAPMQVDRHSSGKKHQTGGASGGGVGGGGDGEMTFEEKRKLSVNLGLLPAEKLGRVVQIINEGPSKIDNSEEEVELDIDKIDNQTLWKLEKYVTSCLRGSKKASHQDKIQRMQQQQEETARKLEDVNATLASRSAGAGNTGSEFSPVSSSKRQENTVDDNKGDSDSSDSESESAEGVGSDGDMKRSLGDVTRVSTTRVPNPPITSVPVAKDKETPAINQAAWETLNEEKKDEAEGSNKDKSNTLWSEFQSREQKELERKEREKREEKEREEAKEREEREAKEKKEREEREEKEREEREMERERQERGKEVERRKVERERERQGEREKEKILKSLQQETLPSLPSLVGFRLKDDLEEEEEEEVEEEEGAL